MGSRELSLADAATNTIRDRILDLTLRPGTQLDETMLRDNLAISRTPAREALNRLTIEGLIEMRPNRGFFVRPIDLGDVTQFFEAYQVSERSVGYYCRFSNAGLVPDLERIQEAHDRAVANQQFLDISKENAAFHIRLAHATENGYLLDWSTRLHSIGRRLAYFVYQREADEKQLFAQRQQRIIDDHHAMIAAVRDGDRDRLLDILTRHGELFRQRIGSFIEGKGKPVFRLAGEKA